MTTRLKVRQGRAGASLVDYANAFTPRKGAPFLDRDSPLVQMGQRFANGESAQGYFKFVDPNGELPDTNLFLRPWSEVRLTEDASGDELIIAWMRLTSGDVQRRGPYMGGDDIEHNPGMMDVNLDLRGIPFRSAWVRPAETDFERMQALEAAKLNGSSSTLDPHRASTDITVETFANGHLFERDPVDLEAWTYPIGTEVSEVVAHIAEQAGKTWGVVLHHDGGATHKCLLYIDQGDVDRFQSAVRISDDLADWDPDDLTAPTFEPHWMQGAGKEADYSQVIQGLISIWGGTDDEPRSVYVDGENLDEEIWVDVFHDDLAKNETQATRNANWQLIDRSNPWISYRPSILVKPEQLHLVTAGQAIEVKSIVMASGNNKGDFYWRRVVECKVEPAANGLWWMHLSLERPRLHGRASGGPGQPSSTNPKPAPEHEPDPADTVVKFYNANDAGGDAESWTGNLANQGGGAAGTSFYNFKSNAPKAYQDTWAATAGTQYRIEGYVNSSSSGQLQFAFSNLSAGSAGDLVAGAALYDTRVISPAQPASGSTWVHFSAGPFTAPAGTNSAALGRTAAVSWDELTIYAVNGGTIENDEEALDYGDYPHDSPYFLPSDYVVARLDELDLAVADLPEAIRNSLSWKQPVRVASTANGTLATAFENGDTVDGVTLATGDRILLKDQTTGADRGIYTVNASGAPTRALDMDSSDEVSGAVVLVMEGTANADKIFICTTNNPITLGTTSLTFTALSGGSGSVATDTIWDAKGDLAAGTGSDTASKLTVGSNDSILMADSGQSTGLKWAPAATTSELADVASSESAGTSDTYARGDHVHAHEAAHINHDTTWAAKGDLIAGTANDTASILTVGSNGQVLIADSTQATGMKWDSAGVGALDLDDLGDVDTTGVSDGDVLTYDSGGSLWVPSAPTGGGGGAPDPVEDIFGTPTSAAFEFNTSSLTGLTAVGSADVADADTTIPGHLYLKDSGSTYAQSGYYATAPSAPFTAITKITAGNPAQNFNSCCLFIGVATPGNMDTMEWVHNTNRMFNVRRCTPTADGSQVSGSINANIHAEPPIWLAIRVNSSSSVDYLWSFDGYLWRTHVAGRNPSITIGSVGVTVKSENVNSAMAAAFDYLRIWSSALTMPG